MSKHTVIWILVFFVSFSVNSRAQESVALDSTRQPRKKVNSLKTFIIKTDLFWPAITFPWQHYYWTVTFEKMIAKRQSVQLTYMDGRSDFKWSNGSDKFIQHKEWFFLLIPEYKFFISKRKLCSGYYLGASLMYVRDRFTSIYRYAASPGYPAVDQFSTAVSNGYGAGLFNGLQFYFFGRLTLDLQAGAIFYDEYYEGESYGGDFLPRLALNIGYRFGLGEKMRLERPHKPRPPEIPWD